MAYIDKQYVPTVWENEVTLIDSVKMNKIEEALVNSEYAESLRFGTLRRSILPLASAQASDEVSTTLIGSVQLSNRYTPGGVAVDGQRTFAATPYAVSLAYANSAAIDTGTPAARIAKESVDAQRLKSAVTISFVGAQVSGNQLTFRNAGTAMEANLVITKDAHVHSTKSIEAQASTSAKGFVKLAQDFTGIAIDAHSDTVPTAKLFKDKVNELNQSIAAETTRINTANSKINNILTTSNIDGTNLKKAVDNANSAKTWVDGFTAEGAQLDRIGIELTALDVKTVAHAKSIDSALATNTKILGLSNDIASSKLAVEIAKGVSAKAWIDTATAEEGLLAINALDISLNKQGVAANKKEIADVKADLENYLTLETNETQLTQIAADIKASLSEAKSLITAQTIVIEGLKSRVAALESMQASIDPVEPEVEEGDGSEEPIAITRTATKKRKTPKK